MLPVLIPVAVILLVGLRAVLAARGRTYRKTPECAVSIIRTLLFQQQAGKRIRPPHGAVKKPDVEATAYVIAYYKRFTAFLLYERETGSLRVRECLTVTAVPPRGGPVCVLHCAFQDGKPTQWRINATPLPFERLDVTTAANLHLIMGKMRGALGMPIID